MGLALKPGVDPEGMRPEILLAVMVAADVYSEAGKDLVVTSLLDGDHRAKSYHYNGLAVDLRIHNLDKVTQSTVTAKLRQRLTTDYDVVLEPDHIHIEFDKKKKGPGSSGPAEKPGVKVGSTQPGRV